MVSHLAGSGVLVIDGNEVSASTRLAYEVSKAVISGVMETTYSAADARKRKLEQRTPEQWEAAIHSYEKWKRARNRKSRGR